ncbi:HAD family hydrolase [Sabulicella rubraurantiaca]|uniref:HAD family hydrolase n=1 Tax=Sabulicella rubraurantiaca TaxID=2811429 RepID=UPI001A95E9BD|nr:HAD family phosphatase [Sabulicella rubraurantiaca]
MHDDPLAIFLARSAFREAGAVITDLDGTALDEWEGRIRVHPEVEFGLKRLAELGRPVAINTLRFPLNVVRTFGRAWSSITDEPLPFVSLNGAQTGLLLPGPGDTVVFDELDAVPVTPAEVAEVLEGVEGLVAGGVEELLVFFYGRDWQLGERIWAPGEAGAEAARDRYRSASEVFHGPVEALRRRLAAEEVLMIFLLVSIPEDKRMAYQHARPSSFVTHRGVDKLDGARRLADRLGFSLPDSVGCGDTPMDAFLAGCGLAVQVGPQALEHKGVHATLRVPDPAGLGALLRRLSAEGGAS